MTLRIACSALGKRIFAGHLTKDGTRFREPRHDVTSDVLKAVIDKIEIGNEVEVSDGESVVARIAVRPPDTTPARAEALPSGAGYDNRPLVERLRGWGECHANSTTRSLLIEAAEALSARAEAQDEGAAGDMKAVCRHAETDADPVVLMLRDINERLDRPEPDLHGARVGVHAVRLAVSSRLLAHPSPPPAAGPRKVSAFPVDGDPVQQMTGLTVADALDDPASSLEILRNLRTSRTLCVWADGSYRVMPTWDVPIARNEEGTLIGVVPIAEVGEVATPSANEFMERIAELEAKLPPAADEDRVRKVATLTRYTPTATGNNKAMMEEDEAGLYVLRKQVMSALKSTAAKEGEKS